MKNELLRTTVHRCDDTHYYATLTDTRNGHSVDVMVAHEMKFGVKDTRGTVNWAGCGSQEPETALQYAELIAHAVTVCDAYKAEIAAFVANDAGEGAYLGAGRYQTKMSGVAKRRVVVDTTAYVREHAHAPKGRGGWLFQMGDVHGLSGKERAERTLNFNGTYTEARKQAVARARELGEEIIYTLP